MSRPTTPAPATLFYSYAPEDEALCEQLERHLSLLQRQGLLSSWHERAIAPGSDKTSEIDEHLNSADIILLLVSASFLASDYCYDQELQRALQRQQRGEARVIPIILRPCDWSSAPFGTLKALPRNGRAITTWTNLDDAFTQVAQYLRLLLDQRSRTSHLSMPPIILKNKQNSLLTRTIVSLLLITFICIGILAYLSHKSTFATASTPTPSLLTSTPTSSYPKLKPFYSGTATGYTNATITFSFQSEDQQGNVKAQTTFQLTTNQLAAIYSCLGQVSQNNNLALSCTEIGHPAFQLSIHGTIAADGHMEGQLEATETPASTYDHIYNWVVTPTSS